MSVFRVYTSDDSFTEVDIPTNRVSEFQVALTFARDRNGEDITNGKFIPSWDTTRVTPRVINNFKTRFPSAKVLVSIGNDHRRFPFQIDESNEPAWIQAATESLTHIIQEYNLDGLDVNYQDFAVSDPDVFGRCVGEVIRNLKLSNVITRASFSINTFTPGTYYTSLYQRVKNFIDHTVAQAFDTSDHEARTNNPGDHRVFLEKLKTFSDPPAKVLFGFTGIREDWLAPSTLPPSVTFVIFADNRRAGAVSGASIKITRWSITYFPPQWVLDLLTFTS